MEGINESNDPSTWTSASQYQAEEDLMEAERAAPVTPKEYQQFLAADAADLEPRPDGVPVPDIALAEAPGLPEGGEVAIRVSVEQIMDQMHQHWSQIVAGQIQRNAELAAALTATNDELTELRQKFAALQQVNAPEVGPLGG